MEYLTAMETQPLNVSKYNSMVHSKLFSTSTINPPSESARMDMELDVTNNTSTTAINIAANMLSPPPTQSLETSFVREFSIENLSTHHHHQQHSFTIKSLNTSTLQPLGNSSLLNACNRQQQQQTHHHHPLSRPSLNSSKIVLNTSANFSSIRIEKKVSPLTEDSESNLKQIIHNIPVLTEIFQIQEKVGEGTFSKVYRARHLLTNELYALKCIIPTIKPSRIIPELRYLRDMGGDANVIEIKTCLFGGGFTVLVMPYFQHDRFSDFFNDMTVLEIKEYMRALLVALRKVHANGVIHRDVKPNNFLYNRREKRYALVDFGLAQNELELLKGWRATSAQHPTSSRSKFSSSVISVTDTSTCSTQRITANQLLAKHESKLVCVRKRLLQEDTTNTINPGHAKRSKLEDMQQGLTPRSKGLQNMTNLLTPNTSMNTGSLVTVPELAPLQLPQPRNLVSTPVKQLQLTPRKNGQEVDPFKTPTKRDKENYFGQVIPSSPGRQIIPETPPKSAKSTVKTTAGSNKLPMPALRPLRSPPRHLTTTIIGPAAKGSATFNKDGGFGGQTATPIRSGCQQQLTTTTTSHSTSSSAPASCKCYGQEQVCRICYKRTDLNAPRAGTPGFRAPEVLLKKMDQTTAIDIWSAGVIFVALLSRRYPFFSSTDDLTSLAEIISLFGTRRVSNAALAIGKTIVTSARKPALNLKEVCLQLRNDQTQVDDSAFDLLDKLLDPNPITRITAADALNHPFLQNPYLL